VSADFHIRSYHPNDVNSVIALFQHSIHDLGAEYYSKAQLAAWAPEAWQQKLSTAHTLIAEADCHLLGFISFYTEEIASGYIDLLYCCPRHIRHGVAGTLYKQAEAILCSKGVNTVHSHVSLSAKAFFTQQGFVTEQLETVYRRGVELARYAMRKALPKSPE
jgi:putative acetyltransferase